MPGISLGTQRALRKRQAEVCRCRVWPGCWGPVRHHGSCTCNQGTCRVGSVVGTGPAQSLTSPFAQHCCRRASGSCKRPEEERMMAGLLHAGVPVSTLEPACRVSPVSAWGPPQDHSGLRAFALTVSPARSFLQPTHILQISEGHEACPMCPPHPSLHLRSLALPQHKVWFCSPG